MKANIGIKEEDLKEVALILNTILADEYVLYTKTKNYHWNITGDNFIELHKLFQQQYEELDEIIDETAERIRYLGHYSEGRLKDFLKITHLDEPDYTTDQQVQIKNLLQDHESVIKYIRGVLPKVEDDYNDAGTTDFITGVMKQHEKIAWFLRSYSK
ncbi:MAG: DNA starvation/stationary phase protection protein [Williamsia sp.]|nr:DNA starvation/stationary phase protection protein [Williamsia sp.]